MKWALPFLLHLGFIYFGLAAGMSRMLVAHNSDTVLPALISLLHWTPYYWGENRLGMLVPLLATPVTDPAFNLILQNVLIAWSAALAVWFFAKLTVEEPSAPLTAALTFVVLLALFKVFGWHRMLLESPYLTPLAPLLGGWYLYARSTMSLPVRAAGLAASLLLSFWINPSNIVLAAAAALLWPGFRWRDRILAAGIVISANGVATAVSLLFPGKGFRELLPPDRWLGLLDVLLYRAAADILRMPALLNLLACGIAVQLIRRKWDARLALGAAACAQICAVSVSEWVARNGGDPRYILPSLFVLGMVAAGTVAVPVTNVFHRISAFLKLPSPAVSTVLASVIIVLAATRAFSFPRPAQAVKFLEEAGRSATESFGSGPCTHLIGDYWRVWMAVYHDMLTGRTPLRQPVTFRSEILRPLMGQVPPEKRLYCGQCFDPSLEYFRITQGVPVMKLTARQADTCQWTAPESTR